LNLKPLLQFESASTFLIPKTAYPPVTSTRINTAT
jgi:hypothetical protein